MGHDTFNVGDLTAVIGDNSAQEQHRAGYNGVWSLTHRTGKRSLFVPTVAGLNLEHIFNGEPAEAPEIFFEPRHAPMTFKRISETEAELHQPPTPTYYVECWTRFKLVAPHYIDLSFRCVAHQHVFPRGYLGLFWASYINAPDDKSMYFLGGLEGQAPLWTQLASQRHNDESTVRHRNDDLNLTFAPEKRDALFKNLSPMRYDEPFFYGLFDNHIWITMFDRADGIRLTQSPSGGGADKERRTSNPAWDFQFIIRRCEVNKEYGFKARCAFRERCSRAEVLDEYRKWKAG
ncbi:MAG: hypothetical protein AB1705_19520 [Verrucomicrobiota bacterium]